MKKSEEIRKKSVEILIGIGEAGRDFNYVSNNEDQNTCVYNGYGLEIIGLDIPWHISTTQIKDNLYDVAIRFDKKFVFNSKTGELSGGRWEEIFDLLYEKLPVLAEEKREKERLKEEAKRLYESTLCDLTSVYITNYLEVIKKKEYIGADEYETEFCIVKNRGEEVFKSSKKEFKDREYIKYTPGDWVDTLKEYVNEVRLEQMYSKNKEIDKTLTLLRNKH